MRDNVPFLRSCHICCGNYEIHVLWEVVVRIEIYKPQGIALVSTCFMTTPFFMELLAWDLVKGKNSVFLLLLLLQEIITKVQSKRLVIGSIE